MNNVVEFSPRGGPRTDAGRRRSSRNSLKHGLWSKSLLLPGEDEAQYVSFARGIVADLDAAGTLEVELAEHVAIALWRLRRLRSYETARARLCDADLAPQRREVDLAQQQLRAAESHYGVMAKLDSGDQMMRWEMETAWRYLAESLGEPECHSVDHDAAYAAIRGAGRLTSAKAEAVFAELVAIIQLQVTTKPAEASGMVEVLYRASRRELGQATAALAKAERKLQDEATDVLLPIVRKVGDFHGARALESLERRIVGEVERARKAFYQHRDATRSWTPASENRPGRSVG